MTDLFSLRIGLGYDIHRLVPGRPLMLGGVQIPFHSGLYGHSDGDVLLHALGDALLGASNLGELGAWYPPTDETIKNIQSSIMLAKVVELLGENGFQIVNVDSILICEEPKLLPHYEPIISKISEILKLDSTRISVKAKTAEKMGEIGDGKAIAAHVVALIVKT